MAALNASQLLRRIRKSTPIALLLSPIGLLIVSAARLLIVANYNPSTALGVLSSQSYVNALLGTVVPLVPVFMPYVALLFLVANRFILGVMALLAAVLISPTPANWRGVANLLNAEWNTAVGGGFWRHALLIGLGLAFATFLGTELAGPGPASFARSVAVVASIPLLPLIVTLYQVPVANNAYVSLIKQPWMPAEAISESSHTEFTGYVLSSDGYWIEVLTAGDRTIKYYRVGDIRDRKICQLSQVPPARPLVTLNATQTPLPQCPALLPQSPVPPRHHPARGPM
jgi:hypothetical protein